MKRVLIILIGAVLFLTALPAHAQTQITDYSTSINGVERWMLDAGQARIPVSWTSINRPLVTNLVFEQILPDGSVVNVELPRPFRWVNSSDSGIVAPLPVGDATTIELRVRMINIVRNDIVYDTAYLYVPVLADTSSPDIVSFSSPVSSVLESEVDAGSGLIEVNWAVSNRPENSNLVFEQVMPDGRFQNAELARDFLIVSSVGSGTVFATSPGDSATELVFRIRLVDLSNDVTLDSEEISISLIDTSSSPAPSDTPDVNTDIVINSFTVNTDSAPGDTQVVFSWDISGDFETAHVEYPVLFAPEIVFTIDSNTGSKTYTIPNFVRAEEKTVTLVVEDPSGNVISSDLTLDITCTWQWQIVQTETGCASAYGSRVGAYQQFQRGFMIWFPRNYGDAIYIFYNDGTADGRSDNWDGSDFTIDGTAPAGMFSPENGFGYLWNTVPEVRSSLGWALAPEQAYTINSQEGFRYNRNDPTRTYYRLPDGRIVRLDSSGGLYPTRTWENAD